LILFFLALTIPTVTLIIQASKQLKWEAFHQQRLFATELVKRIDRRYQGLISHENDRPFTDFSFLNVISGSDPGILKRSPLSEYPPNSNIPGLLGYFQIDDQGKFSTPMMPPSRQQGLSNGISDLEYDQRVLLRNRLYRTLNENQLIGQLKKSKKNDEASPVEAGVTSAPRTQAPVTSNDNGQSEKFPQKQLKVESQAGFDMLQEQKPSPGAGKKSYSSGLGRVEDLKLEKKYQQQALESKVQESLAREKTYLSKRVIRKERNVLPDEASIAAQLKDHDPQTDELGVNIFESEIDAYEFSRLDSGHFVLYRKVWRDGQRYIQGIIIDALPFINGIIGTSFNETLVSNTSDLTIAYNGDVLTVLRAKDAGRYLSNIDALQGTLLLQKRLSQALGKIELIFSVNTLPAGPGGVLVTWLSLIIMLVLGGGFLLIYRLGLKQIKLARQQQDFVSAVSHELKTPLTSIRMYGEMLKEGWADEDKRKTYYEYIYDESERLTRLINNVLQLARMTRNDIKLDLRTYSVSELLDIIKSKVSSLLERNGFEFKILCDEATGKLNTKLDIDYFTQIFINLVDNAIKFSCNAELKQIDIGCKITQHREVQFYIRDYGPGIAKDQTRKIFQLFYRTGSELTRETVGTGIGLALVMQLTQAMNGRIDVVNRDPGAEFSIYLKTVE